MQILRDTGKILLDVKTYVPIADNVLKYLAYNNTSIVLKKIRLEILQLAQGKKLNFPLHPECTKFFLGVNEFSTHFQNFENEPRVIVKFKKLMNLLFMLENIFVDLENTNAIFRYETVARFDAVQTKIHDAVRLLLELSIDPWGLATEDPWPISVLQPVMANFLDVFYANPSQSTPNERVSKLTEKLSSILEHLTDVKKVASDLGKVASDLGFASGMYVDLLVPGENTHFIGQLMSLVPYSFEQLSHHLKLATEHLAAEQAHIPLHRWHELENYFERTVSSLSTMENTPLSIGSTVATLINNLRRIFGFCKEIAQNIGYLNSETQEDIKDKIRYLKFQWLPNLIVSLDTLEMNLMLKEGSLTDNAWPYIENFYQLLIVMMSRVIEFKEQNHDILCLREANWHEVYIQAHLKNQALNEVEKISLQKTIQNFDEYDFSDDAREFTENFVEIAPYLMKIDAKLYNRILQAIRDEVGIQEVFNEFINHESRTLVRQRLEQEYQQYNLMYKMMVSRMKILEEHAIKDLSFIVQSNDVDIAQLASRFQGRHALLLVKKPSAELKTWFFVDKDQESLLECTANPDLDVVFQSLECRPHIEGVPQKLTLGEIQRVEKVLCENCDADMPFLHEVSVANHEPKSLEDIYFHYLMMQRASESAKSFFNILAKVIEKNQYFAALKGPQKRQLQVALKGFQHLVPINTHLTVKEIIGLKRDTLLEIGNKIEKLKSDIHKLQLQQPPLRFDDLKRVEREDYFLKSNNFSSKLGIIQDYYSKIFKIYTPSVQKSFETIDLNLDSQEQILLEPQQVVEQKLVINILERWKAFFENLESYKISNFNDDYFNLHLDIILGYVKCSNVTFNNFQAEHHFGLINQLRSIVTARLQKASANWDYYGAGEMNLPINHQPYSIFYELTHCLYSLPPIIQNLNENTPLSEAQVRDMRQQFAKVGDEVVNLMMHSDSYWWLLWHVPSISKLLIGIKDKYQEACVAFHQKTIDNLYDLKKILFKNIMIECDQIELDLGVNPQYFSDQVYMMINIYFDNLLKPLDFDIAKYAKLSLQNDLATIRRDTLTVKQVDIQRHQSTLKSQLNDIVYFESNESQHNFKKILPYLVRYNKCRAYPSPNALLFTNTIEKDKKYRRWIHEICAGDINIRESIATDGQLPDFETNAYNDIEELIGYTKNAIQGLIATDAMKLEICKEKIDHIDTKIQQETCERPEKVKSIIHAQFSQNVRQMVVRMPFSPEVMQLYTTDFTNHMEQHREDIVGEMHPIVINEMENITRIHAQDDTFAGEASKNFYNKMNEKAESFVEEHYKYYCQLDDILHQLDAFQEYVALQQKLMTSQGFVWFENSSTLTIKQQALSSLREQACNQEYPIKERLDLLKTTISDSRFKQNMCACTFAKEWSITLCIQYFWQLMNWVGLYQFEQDKLYQNLQDELNDYSVDPIHISKYGLFVERHALYQDDFIQTFREGLFS
jgi:hypothetical protein